MCFLEENENIFLSAFKPQVESLDTISKTSALDYVKTPNSMLANFTEKYLSPMQMEPLLQIYIQINLMIVFKNCVSLTWLNLALKHIYQ